MGVNHIALGKDRAEAPLFLVVGARPAAQPVLI
jgi:hypothetical protein